MQEKLKNTLSVASAEIGIPLDERTLNLFEIYYRELLLWNEKMNLVSVKSPVDIIVKHFIDSLTISPYIKKDGSLLDIGSGAGFPGIPLKIVHKELKITLLDASRKKTSFMKNVVRKMELHSIEAVNREAAQFLKEIGPLAFDAVVSRATFKLPDLVRTGAPFLPPGGLLLAMKGKNIKEEFIKAIEISKDFNMELLGFHEFELPVTKDPRTIIILLKSL
jgi:16S rRNA (guanine527-N7)-methyltransferase